MSNTNFSLTRFLPAVTGVFMVFALSLITAGTNGALRGTLISMNEGIPPFPQQTVQVGKLTQGGYHAAAADIMADNTDTTARVLFVGMLLVLAALLVYTVHVIRMERLAMEHSPLRRFQRWLARALHLPEHRHLL